MKNRETDVITLMVDNEFGVLTRVTALIRREGLNIRSLAVAETENSAVSRMTVCLERRHGRLEHVLGRLRRLSSVREVLIFSPETQAARELCLVRVAAADAAALEALCAGGDVQRLEEEGGGALLSACGSPQWVDGFIRQCRELGLLDISRTGILTLDRAGCAEQKEEGPETAERI